MSFPYFFSKASIIIFIIFTVLAIAGAIVALLLFLPEKKKGNYSGFMRKLYDFLNFSTYLISPIMKVLYMVFTFVSLLAGVILMFETTFVIGLLVFILSPVAIRICYEVILLFISIREQLVQINNKMDRIASASDPEGKYIPVAEEPAPVVKKPKQPKYQQQYPPQYQQPYQPPYQPAYQQQNQQQFYQQPQQPIYSQQTYAPQAAPAPRVCPSCGSPVEADALFCMNCGQRL